MDGLRAVACLLVVVLHLYGISGFTWPTGIPKIGVWLFFVLSAFLLTTQLLNGVGLKDYAVGRMLRIVPPFLLAVVIYRLVGTLTIDTWAKAFEVMTFRATSGHLWTIPPELTFYLVLPIIVALLAFAGNRLAFMRSRWLGIEAIVLVAALILMLCWSLYPPFENPENSIWLCWYSTPFLAGVVAAILVDRIKPTGGPMVQFAGWLFAAVAALYAVYGWLFAENGYLLNKHYIFGLPLAALTFCWYVSPPAFLMVKPLVYIGRWAYSIYLYHWAIGVLVAQALQPRIALPVSIVLTILVGFLAYTAIERPTYRLRRVLMLPRPAPVG